MTAGLRLGSYEVLLELAAGGMGRVYVARKVGAAGFERLAVVKRIHEHLLRDPELRDTLRDEAKIAALVSHPHAVGVEDVIDAGGELMLVQPYVESVPLAALLRAAGEVGERLPPGAAARIVADALAGLHAAHEARDLRGEPLRVVHRDVSPHNVLVGSDGRSRLIDFGIAKAERRLTQTRSGVLKGKLSYMAPEALRKGPVDLRADVFAAGVVLHEALTGQRLFDGEDEGAVLLSVMVQEIPPPSALVPGLPPSIDAVVLRALERRPEDRFASALDLQEALEAALAPSPPREVAALVERLCGERLRDERERIRRGLAAPAAPGPTSAPGSAPAVISGDVPAGNAGSAPATSESVPVPVPGSAPGIPGSPVPVAPAPARRRARPLALLLLAVAAAGGAALALRSGTAHTGPPGPPGPPTAATPSVEPSGSSPAAPSSGTAEASSAAAPPSGPPPPAAASNAPPRSSHPARPAPAPSPELHRNPYDVAR